MDTIKGGYSAMRRLSRYIPFVILIVSVAAFFLIIGPGLFSEPVKGSSAESLGVRTENDFAGDPALVALPGEDIVAVLLPG